jgi:hypothetical protein
MDENFVVSFFVWYSVCIARWWIMRDTVNATYMNFFLLSDGLASFFYANIWKRTWMNVGNQHNHQSCFTRHFLVITRKGRSWISFHLQILQEYILSSDLLPSWWITSENGIVGEYIKWLNSLIWILKNPNPILQIVTIKVIVES